MSTPSLKLSVPKLTYSGTTRQFGNRSCASGKSAVESRTIAVFSAVRARLMMRFVPHKTHCETGSYASRAAVRGALHGLDDHVELLVLREAGRRAGLEERLDLARVRRRRETDDRDLRMGLPHGGRRLDAVHPRQPVVHEHDVGPVALDRG